MGGKNLSAPAISNCDTGLQASDYMIISRFADRKMKSGGSSTSVKQRQVCMCRHRGVGTDGADRGGK